MLDSFLHYLHSVMATVAVSSAPAPTTPSLITPAPAAVAPAPVAAAPVTPTGPAPITSVTRGWLPGLPTAVAAAAPVQVAAAPTADEVVGKVQTFYATVNHLTAKFRQEFTNATFGDTKISDGSLWIMKPGKMRWDYFSKSRKGQVKVEKSFISNGSYLYVVEHQNKQVIKKNLQKDLTPVAVSFLYGKGDLRADFNAALDTTGKFGNKGDLVLKLTPKTPSAQYKNLYLVVDSTAYRVKQSIIVDSANNVNHFRFFEPDFVKPVKDDWFVFDEKSVKNYRIVDADQQKGAPTGP
jgi:outer membrane lipoprotein-sorting protein